MALSVNTNTTSLTAQMNLAKSQSRMNTSLERLSTGLKINRASDDPAGLVTSELQKSQISGLTKAIENIERGTTMVQTAESGLAEIGSLLLKMRDLAVNSANEATQDTASLAANQSEIDALSTSITRISDTTKFGTKALLDGTVTAAQFQIGAFSTEVATLTVADSDAAALSVDALDITTAAGSTTAIADIDAAISTITTARGDLGAFQSGTLNSTKNNNASQLDNLKNAESILRDTDYQKEISNYTSEQIRQQAAQTVLGMANQSSQSIIQLLRG
ncbi:MAG: flagellin [Planctomycetota bacterium]|nr:flagellin [Planctomycetales bacterium]RLS43954.1 MAG: flagellin [Planctomycetota bacterium]